MITIINLEPNENGAYANQAINFKLPENWAVVPRGLEDKAAELLPFANLVLDEVGNIIDITDNPEAREAAEESRKALESRAPKNGPTAQIKALRTLVTLLLDHSDISTDLIEPHQSELHALGMAAEGPIEDDETQAPKKGKGK